MDFFSKKRIIALVFALVLIGLVLFLAFNFYGGKETEEPSFIEEPEEELEEEFVWGPAYEVLGRSAEERIIESFTFGSGDTHLLFVGGIHGGYEWNSVVLAYEFIDYFSLSSETIPENLTVTVIPSANPDGVYKIVGKEGRFSAIDVPTGADITLGRFNANGVDLNRNFDCKWQTESTWRGEIVSAGFAPFSEPEAVAIRNFVFNNNPKAVIFWHSQANAVYASECEDGIIPETLDIMNAYSEASNYRAIDFFDAYAITGDAEGWLASIGIPAITVELEPRENIEWDKNLSGVKAVFNYYK